MFTVNIQLGTNMKLEEVWIEIKGHCWNCGKETTIIQGFLTRIRFTTDYENTHCVHCKEDIAYYDVKVTEGQR